MNKIKCVIVDDEPSGRIVLTELVRKHCNEVEIVGEAANVDEAYSRINALKPDFIFLDIRMPGGSGFDLLKMFKKVEFEVVFVTSHNDYAINAFKYSALDYLLKPVEVVDLKRAVEKVKAVKALKSPVNSLIENFLENINESNPEKKMAIHIGDKVKFIKLSEVICFEAEGNYTKMYMNDGEVHQMAKPLGDLESGLPEEMQFWRVNRGAIINLEYIKHYTKGTSCVITLSNDLAFEVSRRKKAEMNERLSKVSN